MNDLYKKHSKYVAAETRQCLVSTYKNDATQKSNNKTDCRTDAINRVSTQQNEQQKKSEQDCGILGFSRLKNSIILFIF